MPDRELSSEEIEMLSQPHQRKPTYTVPGTTRRKKYDPDIRTIANWFKLPHTMSGECQIPHHDVKREARDKPRMFFRYEDGMLTCRWCFIESRDKITDG